MTTHRNQSGVTLIELIVTLSVLAILITLAAPSFSGMAERSALRGASDNALGVIAAAREEAIKRDQLVRVDFIKVGTGFCVGAITVPTAATAGCNCTVAAQCTVAAYPESVRDLHRVTVTGDPVFGSNTGFVIDPKTGTLENFADSGSIELGTAGGYTTSVRINAMGRASICSPGSKSLPGVKAC